MRKLGSYLDAHARLSRQQLLLRAVPLPATVAFAVLVGLAGGPFRPLFVVPAVLLAALVTLLPDSSAALFLLLDLVVLWSVSVPERLGAPVLVAALLLLVLHLAVTLAAVGPPGLVLERSLLRLWALRGVLLAATAVGTWVAARLLAGVGMRPSGWAMATGLAVLLAWTAVLTVRLSERGDAPAAR